METPNPIGISVSNEHIPFQKKLALGKTIGAHYFQPHPIAVDDWTHSRSLRERYQRLCANIVEAGLEPVVTITPSLDIPNSEAAYSDILITCRPALIVLNRADNQPLNLYLEHLNTLTRIAHSNGVDCTHEPIDASDIAVLLYETSPHIINVLDPTEQLIFSDQYATKREEVRVATHTLLDTIAKSGVNFVNISWNSQSEANLETIVEFAHEYTAKPTISTSIARPVDTYRAEKLMRSVTKLEMPYAIWYFSVEGPNGFSLVNPEGTLGKTTSLFTQFMRRNFKTQ